MTKNKYSLNILHNITKPISKFNECETFSPWKMLLLLSKFNMTKHYSSCHSSLPRICSMGLAVRKAGQEPYSRTKQRNHTQAGP